MTFKFISCINFRKVTLSPLLRTDLVFFVCRNFFCLSPVKLQWMFNSLTLHVQYVMINSISQFPLHSVAFCFDRYTDFSTSAKRKKKNCILFHFWRFHFYTLGLKTDLFGINWANIDTTGKKTDPIYGHGYALTQARAVSNQKE